MKEGKMGKFVNTTPMHESKIFKKIDALKATVDKDEDLKNFIAAMLAAYPSYSRKVRYYRKKLKQDFSLSSENILSSGSRFIRGYGKPIYRALDAEDMDSRLTSHPLFYELAEKAFSVEEKMKKGR
jgi:hypothetical protein